VGTPLGAARGDLAGRWLDCFAPGAGDRWAGTSIDWHGRDPLVLLERIAADPQAARALLQWLDVIVVARASLIVGGPGATATADLDATATADLHALARLSAAVQAATRRHAEAQGDKAYGTWVTVWNLPATIASLALPAAAQRFSPAIDLAAEGARRWWEESNLPGAQPEPDFVRAREHERIEHRRAAHQAAVVGAAFQAAAARVGLGPSVRRPPPPHGLTVREYERAVEAWVAAPGPAAERRARRQASLLGRAFDTEAAAVLARR
jgi:hypothetical protein